jgi:hypothetical protein
MLYVGMFGIILGTAFGHHFSSANITAAAVAAAAWVSAVGLIGGHGLLKATREALFLTWSLETGIFCGLLLLCLGFQRRAPVIRPPTGSPG